tara:strand:- start:68 stop:310 length:243 start_codon:yes stop_codon:yes gene_type:complete
MILNSILHIEKTSGNFHHAGSFATILFNAIEKDETLQLISIEKHDTKKFTDVLKVNVNGKAKRILVRGGSVNSIINRLKK